MLLRKNIYLILIPFILVALPAQAESAPFQAWGPIQIGETTDEALNIPYEKNEKKPYLDDGVVIFTTKINNQQARIDALPSNGIISSVFITFLMPLESDHNCTKYLDEYTKKLETEYSGTLVSNHSEMLDVIPFSDEQHKGISNSLMVSNNNYINIVERKYNENLCKITISFESH